MKYAIFFLVFTCASLFAADALAIELIKTELVLTGDIDPIRSQTSDGIVPFSLTDFFLEEMEGFDQVSDPTNIALESIMESNVSQENSPGGYLDTESGPWFYDREDSWIKRFLSYMGSQNLYFEALIYTDHRTNGPGYRECRKCPYNPFNNRNDGFTISQQLWGPFHIFGGRFFNSYEEWSSIAGVDIMYDAPVGEWVPILPESFTLIAGMRGFWVTKYDKYLDVKEYQPAALIHWGFSYKGVVFQQHKPLESDTIRSYTVSFRFTPGSVKRVITGIFD